MAFMAAGPIRTAVLGYGTAGRVFHTPFLAADDRYSLDAVVTGNQDRACEVSRRHHDVAVLSTSDEVFAEPGRYDLVVIATPPHTHAELATRAIEAGTAVVVDKPFCASAAAAQELVDRAARHDVPLTVFHNRRWDGDFLTVRDLLDRERLGTIRRFESRFEVWKPGRKGWKAVTPPSAAGGTLYDLGSHLVDQAVQLFGPVTDVHAELLAHAHPGVDDDSFVALTHTGGVRSHLWMNTGAAQPGPRFRLLGSDGAFTKSGLDPQEDSLAAGAVPGDDGFGHEPEQRWGMLGVDGSLTAVPTLPGSYAGFYTGLADSLLNDAPLPVQPNDAVAVVEILEKLHQQFPVVAAATP